MVNTHATCFERSRKVIAQGALTNSKRPECFIKGVYPTHLIAGNGVTVYDEIYKPYIDYICALGANYFGYGNIELRKVVDLAYSMGAVLSLGTDTEVSAAEEVIKFFPMIEKLKFYKNGGDACTAAVRIARSWHEINNTGKDLILSDGYHGNMDSFISMTKPARGCFKQDFILPITFENIKNAACVILEPVITDYSEERKKYLQELRDECSKYGAILIFDEVITGLRFPGYSVSSYFGINPDLICLGKALGGGLPISIVGGKKELMETDYFYSTTFSGDRVALSAMKKCLEMIKFDKDYSIDKLWIKGKEFIDKFNTIFEGKCVLDAYPTRGVFKYASDGIKALIMQEFCKAGILIGPSWFYNFHHPKHDDLFFSIADDINNRLNLGLVKLEGEMPQVPFAQKVRE